MHIGARAHIERSKGTVGQNKKYCTKEEGRISGPWEFGIENVAAQGKRNDLHEFVKEMKESELDDGEIIEKYPDIVAKYPRFIERVRESIRMSRVPEQTYEARSEWQKNLQRDVEGEPDGRKIRWYYDEVGGSGKSTFARSYGRKRQCFVATSGKYADVLYAYSAAGCPRIIIFDWARSEEEHFPYGLLEKLKNGFFLNTKYESKMVFFNIPHIIVFANFRPDERKWSRDRLDVHVINEHPFR